MRKFWLIMGIVILAAGATYFFRSGNTGEVVIDTSEEKLVLYESGESGPNFTYPESWGKVVVRAGNTTCPEEDTYRSADTLSVFDQELSFPERRLPGSDSIIRTGIRLYELNQKFRNACGDDFLLTIATEEINPQSISSSMLTPLMLPSGLKGFYNPEASRLNTEARAQYTFFLGKSGGFYVIQAYMSFIPYFGSPELKELEENFGGDMEKYLAEGTTADPIRKHREKFNAMAESLYFEKQ